MVSVFQPASGHGLTDGLVRLLGRRRAWRLGRKLYTAARGEGLNAIETNGEKALIEQVISAFPDANPFRAWDVCANLGEWTDLVLATAARQKRVAKILMFEPTPTAFGSLSAKYAGNAAVEVEQVALSSKAGTADFEELAHVELTFAEREAARKPDLDAFVRIGDRVVQDARSSPLGGAVAGFFRQFAHAAQQRRLARIDLASRELDHHARQRVAPLALDDEAAIIEERHDHHGARVDDVFTLSSGAIGQADLVAPHIEKGAAVDLVGDQRLLAQGRVVRRRGDQVANAFMGHEVKSRAP